MELQFGTVAEWVTGLITAGAVGIAWYELRQDRQRWTRERSDRVHSELNQRLVDAAHVEMTAGDIVRRPEQVDHVDAFDIRISTRIRNESSSPLFDLKLWVDFAVPVTMRPEPWDEQTTLEFDSGSKTMLSAGEDYSFPEVRCFASSAPIIRAMWFEWTDTSFYRWKRGGDGMPELVHGPEGGFAERRAADNRANRPASAS